MKFNGRNIYIGSGVELGKDVRIGDNVTIYDNVIIKDGTTICNDCVIGEPLGSYYDSVDYVNPKTIIGENCLIRSHSIIYSGCKIGDNFSTGHRITIREDSIIGDNCRIGTLCDLQGHLQIGNHCWLHSNIHVSQGTKIGDFVFVYPYVIFTNDPHPPSTICNGSTVGDYAQIAVSSVILPGVTIGKHALIGAKTLVSKNVLDYQLVTGSPGKLRGDVRDLTSKETGKSHYPWPYNFERGMPWAGIGYDNWINNKDKNDK